MSKLLNILNDMQPRQLLILSCSVAAIMFAIVFCILFFWSNSEKEVADDSQKATPEMVNVVSAKMDIAAKAVIRENMLQLKKVSSDSVPTGAITNVAEVVNNPARTKISAGEIITDKKVYLDMSQAGFVGVIPPDCRAVSISVNGVTGVDGFAKAGDYVDLLLVEQGERSATTNILLQNVLLLSINQNMTGEESQPTGDKNPAANPKTTAVNNPSIATLALKPNEAIQLVSVSKLGEIYLMLRPLKPSNMYVGDLEYTAVSSNEVQTYSETLPAPAPAVTLPEQPAPTVPAATVPLPNASVPTPDIPSSKPAGSNIKIIQGDQILTK